MIVRSRDLFNRNVRVAITTKEFGSLHPKRPDFAEQLARLLRVTNGGDVALFPQLGFTDQLAWATGARSGVVAPFPDHKGNLIPAFLRPLAKTDGAISPNLPLAMCNADCPAGIGLTSPDARGHQHLVFTHLGLMAMISKEGRPSLLKQVVDTLAVVGMHLEQFWVGFGAQPCCYGLGHNDDRWGLIDPWQSSELVVEKGPRAGQRAVDLGVMARAQLVAFGMPFEDVQVDDYCTCCSGEDDPQAGLHHSNLMRCDQHERNGIIAWRTDPNSPARA
ncbi:MAG: laccase domain-containing protein [Candidatus Doudnabacteria bacterium]|nr:laccase domain-containing protein [Candidatus Doudnabacteria bacterium]